MIAFFFFATPLVCLSEFRDVFLFSHCSPTSKSTLNKSTIFGVGQDQHVVIQVASELDFRVRSLLINSLVEKSVYYKSYVFNL